LIGSNDLPNGIYIIQLSAGENTVSRMLAVMR